MTTEFRPHTTLAILTVAIAGLLMTDLTGQAARPPYPAPCTVTFGDRATDNVFDDGGPYVDGQTGVSCQVGGPNSTNIALNLSSNASSKRNPRRMYASFTNPAYGPVLNTIPANYMTILGIANMLANTTRVTDAHFLLNNSSYSLNWCGTGGYPSGSPCLTQGPGSQSVLVSRLASPNQSYWVVTTDPYAYDTRVGDEADRYQYSNSTVLGLYHMPFQLTVYCPTCP